VNGILEQVGSVALHYTIVVLLRSAAQNPSHVRPPAAVTRRVWVARFLGMRMMDAVSYDPVDGAAFQSQQSTGGQKIFD
jgi:hypothetical protein